MLYIVTQASAGESVETQAAYRRMLSDGELDRCGVTLLAGKAVGAPFVGAVAATLALAEVLRLLHGGPLHGLIDLDLQSVDHRVATRHQVDFSQFNPGYSLAAG
jgi:pheromone shutdown protein TraB